jgi:hypothetical protein
VTSCYLSYPSLPCRVPRHPRGRRRRHHLEPLPYRAPPLILPRECGRPARTSHLPPQRTPEKSGSSAFPSPFRALLESGAATPPAMGQEAQDDAAAIPYSSGTGRRRRAWCSRTANSSPRPSCSCASRPNNLLVTMSTWRQCPCSTLRLVVLRHGAALARHRRRVLH